MKTFSIHRKKFFTGLCMQAALLLPLALTAACSRGEYGRDTQTSPSQNAADRPATTTPGSQENKDMNQPGKNGSDMNKQQEQQTNPVR